MQNLVGPYNTGIDPVKYGLSSDIGVRDLDHGINLQRGNNGGKPFKYVVFYGHDARQYADDFESLGTETQVLHAGDLGLDSTTKMQHAYQALPREMGVGAFVITPGIYNDEQAKFFTAGNKSYPRWGDLDVGGLEGYQRPVFNSLSSKHALRFVRQDNVCLQHMIWNGIGVSHDAGSLTMKGIAQQGYRLDGVHIGDPDAVLLERLEMMRQGKYGHVLHRIYDWECWGTGQGNTKQQIYAQFRMKALLVMSHILSYASNGSQCVKAPLHAIALLKSILSNVAKIETGEYASNRYSTNLFNSSASGYSFIDDVLFISASGNVRVGDFKRTVVSDAIEDAARRAIRAGDIPYQYGRDPEYLDINTWEQRANESSAPTELDSNYSHRIQGRIGFHRIDLRELGNSPENYPSHKLSNNTESVLNTNYGTFPRWPVVQFSAGSIYAEFSPELMAKWIETSHTFINKNLIKTNVDLVDGEGNVLVSKNVSEYNVDDLTAILFQGNRNGPAFSHYNEEGKAVLKDAPEYIPDRGMSYYDQYQDVLPPYFLELINVDDNTKPPPIVIEGNNYLDSFAEDGSYVIRKRSSSFTVNHISTQMFMCKRVSDGLSVIIYRVRDNRENKIIFTHEQIAQDAN